MYEPFNFRGNYEAALGVDEVASTRAVGEAARAREHSSWIW